MKSVADTKDKYASELEKNRVLEDQVSNMLKQS